jgi:N,N'-diacetyllegionaminate synthase
MTLRELVAATPAGRALARREGCIVVGEVGQAHDGSLGLAHAFVDAIADAGADAVKFQTHIAAAESTPREPWRVRFSPQDDTRYGYWRRTQFTEPQWAGLKQHADDRGLVFLSSPFSAEAVRLLAALQVAAWKVASGEVCNLPLLEAMAEHRVPILLSSGMSGMAELDAAVRHVTAAGVPCAVMQCTSAYPCPPEKAGLNLLSVFRERYRCPVGLSDHSGTPYPSLAAVVLGADIVEVHVTLSREMFGPDVPASITSAELAGLVTGIRSIEAMLGHPLDKDAMSTELAPLRQLFTKSVVARTDLNAGTVLQREHLTTKKPGTGLPAARLGQLVGARLRRDLHADDLVVETDVEANLQADVEGRP